jgi:hypothetical protein
MNDKLDRRMYLYGTDDPDNPRQEIVFLYSNPTDPDQVRELNEIKECGMRLMGVFELTPIQMETGPFVGLPYTLSHVGLDQPNGGQDNATL